MNRSADAKEMGRLERALYRSLLSAAKRLELQVPRHGKTGVFSEVRDGMASCEPHRYVSHVMSCALRKRLRQALSEMNVCVCPIAGRADEPQPHLRRGAISTPVVHKRRETIPRARSQLVPRAHRAPGTLTHSPQFPIVSPRGFSASSGQTRRRQAFCICVTQTPAPLAGDPRRAPRLGLPGAVPRQHAPRPPAKVRPDPPPTPTTHDSPKAPLTMLLALSLAPSSSLRTHHPRAEPPAGSLSIPRAKPSPTASASARGPCYVRTTPGRCPATTDTTTLSQSRTKAAQSPCSWCPGRGRSRRSTET